MKKPRNTLTLSLKREWFDLIKSGVKREEYREIKPRYLSMFCKQTLTTEPDTDNEFLVGFHLKDSTELRYDTLEFTLAYPSRAEKDKWLVFRNPKIRIGAGNPEWGAEPDKLYFVVTWEV